MSTRERLADQKRRQKAKNKAKACEMRANGCTFVEIGKKFGITRQTASTWVAETSKI